MVVLLLKAILKLKSKIMKTILAIFLLGTMITVHAQEASIKSET